MKKLIWGVVVILGISVSITIGYYIFFNKNKGADWVILFQADLIVYMFMKWVWGKIRH
jgi:hypothetical protein